MPCVASQGNLKKASKKILLKNTRTDGNDNFFNK